MTHRIAFFACSTIALSSIQSLREQGLLACVVLPSQQDQGSSILEQYLIHLQLPYFRTGSKNTKANLDLLQQSQADLALVVTYNEILPSEILHFFEKGIFNLHASALPQYRGPVPLFWQLKNNEKESALTFHRMTEKVDAGEILIQQKYPIEPSDTIGTLSAKVTQIAPSLIQQLVQLIDQHGTDLPLTPQIGEGSSHPAPQQSDILINWKTMNGSEIEALTRACNPAFVGAQFIFKEAYFSLIEAEQSQQPHFGAKPGTTIHVGNPEGFIVATTDGCLRLNVIATPEGIFSGVHFANRLRIDAGETLG